MWGQACTSSHLVGGDEDVGYEVVQLRVRHAQHALRGLGCYTMAHYALSTSHSGTNTLERIPLSFIELKISHVMTWRGPGALCSFHVTGYTLDPSFIELKFAPDDVAREHIIPQDPHRGCHVFVCHEKRLQRVHDLEPVVCV